MSWLYEHFSVPSTKNNSIVVSRSWGTWSIKVNLYDETTPYTNTMWQRSLLRLPKNFRAKKILLLGLGAGGVVTLLQEYFRDATIDAIEWDPAMVEVAKRCALFVFNDKLTIHIGDATEIVPRLTGQYDLIIVDLFTGEHVAPALTDASFANALQHLLAPEGSMLVNIFHSPEMLTVFDRVLGRHDYWRYRYNHLALYQHHGRGATGDPLPEKFLHNKQSRLYLEHNSSGEIIGTPGALGTRTRRGPFYFESYTTDTEPILAKQKGIGFISWHRLARTDIPKGWVKKQKPYIKQTGFAEIKNPAAYWDDWTDHAKRHRRKSLRESSYTIEPVSADEFTAAYRRESHLFITKYPFIGILRYNTKHHGDRFVCIGARDTNGALIAGLAVLDLPDANISNHTISFIAKRARNTSVGTGLIDAWFQHEIRRGITFLNFGTFWAPKDPFAWKGFSQFKAQFGIHLIRYPRQLTKIIW